MVELEELQQTEVACYEPMGWLGKQFLRVEKTLGYAPKNSN